MCVYVHAVWMCVGCVRGRWSAEEGKGVCARTSHAVWLCQMERDVHMGQPASRRGEGRRGCVVCSHVFFWRFWDFYIKTGALIDAVSAIAEVAHKFSQRN